MPYVIPVDEPGFDFRYVETSIPAGVTMAEYRRARPRRPARWHRLKRLAVASTRTTAQAGCGG
jgi:hypothetical protein